MTLIVEDGTGVTNANTYADLATVRSHAVTRGVTLNADDDSVTPYIYLAMDYLEGKSLGMLSLTWPATDDKVCGKIKTAEAIARLSQSVCQLCVEQHNGVDLAPARTEGFITEETVGPLTTKYSDKHGGGAGTVPDMPAVDNILAPLLAACGQVGLFKTKRV